MKRKIEFRGKCIDTGRWFFGNLFVNDEDDRCYIHYRYRDEDWRVVEVIPETVGQYTGLKDKNGEQIFEDDIISYYRGKRIADFTPCDGLKLQIIYENYEATSIPQTHENWSYNIISSSHLIGNIHENPELLK